MDLFIQIAKELCDKLKENNIKHFIDFGTLLGAYRENNIINDDIDFDILYIDDEENKNFLFSFIFSDIIKKYDLKITSTNWGINYNLLKNKFRFEFYPVEIKEKRYWPKNLKGYTMPLFFIDELETIKIKNLNFPCPRHLSQYLIHRYGYDYKTPKLKSKDNKFWSECIENIIPIKEKYTAYTCGVFDIFHYGHLRLFERMSNNFDKIIVGIHSDEDVMDYKRKPYYDYNIRKYMVKSCKFISEIYEYAEVITTDNTLEKFECDYVVVGRENEQFIKEQYNVNSEKLHLINRTENISTTQLLTKLLNS